MTHCVIGPGKTHRVTGYKRTTHDGVTYLAHRWAWIQVHGWIPPGHDIHHVCRNKECWSVLHLVCKPRGVHQHEHYLEDGPTGIAAVHALATVCTQGHAFDGHDGKQRRCSTCHRKAAREWARRNRAAA